MTTTQFQKASKYSKKISVFCGIYSLLDWDMETYMPGASVLGRAEQIEHVQSHIHELKQAKEWRLLLDTLDGEILSSDERRSVELWQKDCQKAAKIPHEFVEAWSRLTAEATAVWKQARKENNFSLFETSLEKIIEMSRKKSEFLGFDAHPYDPLLDEYEPDVTTKDVETLFGALREQLVPLIQRIQPVDDALLKSPCDLSQQMEFGKLLLSKIGFNFQNGRLDESVHPFSSTLHPEDSRITTRFLKNNLMSNIRTILHEAGHSFYDTGIDKTHWGTPIAQALSLGIHESQSRLWETQVGLSRPFWNFLFPHMTEKFPQFKSISIESWMKAINKVEPTFIRVEADEATYGLHIMLRFELEKGLIEGSIKVKDLPMLWRAKSKELFGIEPEKDTDGVLQDIHWASGAFGYFPTYLLGSVWAAGQFAAFKKSDPQWEAHFEKGNFSSLHLWLKENIWVHGKRYSQKVLLEKVGIDRLSPQPYINYLKAKYLI